MKTIVAFGDSVLKGIINENGRYSVSKNSFAHICEQKLGIRLLNKSMMGATVTKGEQIFERSLKFVLEDCDETVVFEFGGNDCDYDWEAVANNSEMILKPNNSLESFKEGYTKLICRVREIGKEPILLSLPPIDANKYFHWISRNRNANCILKFLGGTEKFLEDWHELYNLEVFKIAYQNEVKMIDISSCFYKTRNYRDLLCIDGIHPNERGHKLIAEEIIRCFA